MFSRVSLPMILLAAAIALPGEATAATAAELEAQRSAILDCKRLRGIGGAAYIEQRTHGAPSNQMAVQIAPYDRVTFQSADAINRCAASRLGLSEAEIAEFNSRSRTVVRSLRAPGGYRGLECGRNPVILYKGDLYCQWARR